MGNKNKLKTVAICAPSEDSVQQVYMRRCIYLSDSLLYAHVFYKNLLCPAPFITHSFFFCHSRKNMFVKLSRISSWMIINTLWIWAMMVRMRFTWCRSFIHVDCKIWTEDWTITEPFSIAHKIHLVLPKYHWSRTSGLVVTSSTASVRQMRVSRSQWKTDIQRHNKDQTCFQKFPCNVFFVSHYWLFRWIVNFNDSICICVFPRAYKTELLSSIITLYRQRFSQIFIWLVRQQKSLLYFQKNSQGPLVKTSSEHFTICKNTAYQDLDFK